MALIMDALTTRNTCYLFEVLQQTDAGTNMMQRPKFLHEGLVRLEAIVAKVCRVPSSWVGLSLTFSRLLLCVLHPPQTALEAASVEMSPAHGE
jgi:hypothetical protein